MKIEWENTPHDNLDIAFANVIARGKEKNLYRKFYNVDYTNAPQKKLFTVAFNAIKKLKYADNRYGKDIKYIRRSEIPDDSPFIGWSEISLTNNDGTVNVYIDSKIFLSIVEEIIGIKLLRKDDVPIKYALQKLHHIEYKYVNWSVKFLTDKAVLISNPNVETEYLLAPAVFDD